MPKNRPSEYGTTLGDPESGATLDVALKAIEDLYQIYDVKDTQRMEKLKGKQLSNFYTIQAKEDEARTKALDRELKQREEIALAVASMVGELSHQNIELDAKLQERYARVQDTKNKIADQERIKEYFKSMTKKAESQSKDELKRAERAAKLAQEQAGLGVIGEGGSVKDGLNFVGHQLEAGLKNVFDGKGISDLGTDKLAKAIDNLTAGINTAMEKYANYHAQIDTRLQGSYYSVLGSSSFDKLVGNLGVISNSGLLSTEELYENLNTLVDAGVVTNLEQRAFFGTIKDTVATTFDVNSKALNRIIRLQQDDSTAIRLGMESYLTRFLNEFVESTEYLTSTFDSVADALLEASSLMGKGQSAEFEYIVQKWLGTLTGLGLSEGTSQNIATAIGQLASGNINSLSSSEMQNLIVMAASKAGLSYAEMLTNGMDAFNANDLLLGVVEYMQEIGSYSSNVVKSELARTFGVTVSDIVAAQNMTSKDLNTAYRSMMSSGNMTGELVYQLSQTGSRLGISKILSNLYSNTQYSTGMSIAKNPALYALWKITDFISSATGQQGVAIPSFSVMGNQIDLETTVDALLKGGIAGIGMLSNIGGIISGLASTVTGSGNVLWGALEASTFLGNAIGKAKSGLGFNTNFYSNGLGGVSRKSGATTSVASYAGNYSGDDYSDSVVNDANDSASDSLDQKKQDEDDPITAYLKDMEFANKMEQISEDIKYFREDGIKVKNMPTSFSGGTDIMGFFTGALV